MKRFGFLKLLGASAVVTQVPLPVKLVQVTVSANVVTPARIANMPAIIADFLQCNYLEREFTKERYLTVARIVRGSKVRDN